MKLLVLLTILAAIVIPIAHAYIKSRKGKDNGKGSSGVQGSSGKDHDKAGRVKGQGGGDSGE